MPPRGAKPQKRYIALCIAILVLSAVASAFAAWYLVQANLR